MAIAVLTYHSNNVLGNDYASNDHVAMAEDLRLLAALKLPVVSLSAAVDALYEGRGSLPGAAVAISFDDGSWFDWYDLPHPTLGPQPGFRRLLRESPQPACGTAFVIASPQARAELDRTCLIGQGWWGEEWWSEAEREGLIAIENHSWDHNHDSLAETVLGVGRGGNFHAVGAWEHADGEIRQAADYLDARRPRPTGGLFAYPYGHCSDYLVRDYLPGFRDQHRQRAAFTTEPTPMHAGGDRWRIGRYVCGDHWRSPEGLQAILRDALGV